MDKQVYVQDALSITNDCFACLQADSRCIDCQESYDNNQTIMAHNIVDEGNQQYVKQWLRPIEELNGSGHDWISPLVRLKDGSIRQEFVDPVVSMEDRTFNPMLELANDEKVCAFCHYACLARAKCPNCDEVNA
jgi:hypothetical protein